MSLICQRRRTTNAGPSEWKPMARSLEEAQARATQIAREVMDLLSTSEEAVAVSEACGDDSGAHCVEAHQGKGHRTPPVVGSGKEAKSEVSALDIEQVTLGKDEG